MGEFSNVMVGDWWAIFIHPMVGSILVATIATCIKQGPLPTRSMLYVFTENPRCSRIFASSLTPPKMCHNLNSLPWGWLSHPWYGILIMGIYTPIIGLMTIPHTPKNHHGTKKWKFGRVFSFSNTCSGRWFQPIWKIWSSKWVHLSPIFGVNIKNVWVATT